MLPVTRNPRLGAAAIHDPFAGAPLAAFYPLAEAQREVWLAASMEVDANLAYNEGLKLHLRGTLNVQALHNALQTIVNRHEALRSVVSPNGQSLMVLDALTLELPTDDLRGQAAELADTLADGEMREPFNLVKGPLVRARLLRIADDYHQLLFIAHHVICDGWSAAVVMTELGALYSAAVRGESVSLYEPQRFGDYSQIEAAFLASDEGKAHTAYWLKQLHQAPPTLDLPTGKRRPSGRSYAANRVDFRISEELVTRLRRTGSAHKASLVATVLAGFAGFLHRLTGAEDMVIGLAAAGQALHNQLKLVGHCVNLLPLRLRPEAQAPFTALLGSTRQVVLDAFEHQGTTFGSLLPQLQLERDDSRPPLVSIVFNIDVRDDDITHEGLQVSYDTLIRRGENFELFVNAVDNGRDLVLEASYNSDLFSELQIQSWLKAFEAVLETIADAPQTAVGALPLMTSADQSSVLALNPAPTADAPQTIHGMVLAAAATRPVATAVRFGSETLSYTELDQQSADLAGALAAKGVTPGSLVAVNLERSLQLPVALLAVLRAGAGYVALDPELPADRVADILAQAQPALLLTQASLPQPAGIASLCLEDAASAGQAALPASVPDSQTAYVIFTSGSTGRPKGVMVSHANVVNCLRHLASAPGLAAEETAIAVASITFDFSVYELFLPLTVGATLLVADRESCLDGARLRGLVEQHHVTSLHATPASFRLLLGAGWAGNPRFRAVFGGESLPRDLIEQLEPKVGEIWNIYGPTEVTITSNLCRVSAQDAVIAIGPPIRNTQCYVLDASQQLLPRGMVGELYVGGAGVTQGYLGQPALSAERYIANPFGPGKLYRTGDLVRWLPSGALECLGRADFQVKLRGYRIELPEIEYQLSRHSAVAEAVCDVVERSTGDKRLVAWYTVHAGQSVTSTELRQHLRQSLPGYMVPQQTLELDALPRLANGKLNRRALPNPFAAAQGQVTLRNPPQAGTEATLAAMWAEVLNVQDISREDRFLDLGGHSLLAVQMAATIEQHFGQRPSIRSVMTDSLAGLAATLPPPLPSKAAASEASAPAAVSSAAAPTAAEAAPVKKGLLGRLFGA